MRVKVGAHLDNFPHYTGNLKKNRYQDTFCHETIKKPLIIGTMVSWFIIIVTFMFSAGSFNMEILFVLWLIGILIIAELSIQVCPPSYVRNIMIIAGVGTILFGIIVIRKVWVILYG